MTPRPPHSREQTRMIALLRHLAPTEGYTRSRLDDVTFMRADRPLASTPTLYEPSIVIVLQGSKRGLHDGKVYTYDARHHLVLTVPLPFSVETVATPDEPMLGLAIRIDLQRTAELAMTLDDGAPPAHQQPASLYASPTEPRLENATLRLLEALNSPDEAQVLGPMILHEITYRVLTGDQAGSLRAALTQDSHFNRIAKVLRRIHAQYPQDMDVTTLARQASMSVPAFHARFKAITATTPIQYIKNVRLHQARLMMIRNGMNAASAAEQVGYVSASQFSREFKRLFGRSPLQEARHLQQALALSSAVATQIDGASLQSHTCA